MMATPDLKIKIHGDDPNRADAPRTKQAVDWGVQSVSTGAIWEVGLEFWRILRLELILMILYLAIFSTKLDFRVYRNSYRS